MKNILLILLAIVVLVVGYVVTRTTDTPEPVEEQKEQVQNAIYTNNELGIEFEYPVGPAGLVLEERAPLPEEPTLLHTITMMQTDDYERMNTNLPVGGEGPAVIAVHILANADDQFSLGAAEQYNQYSNFNLKTGFESEVVVGGANAVRYMADGLYSSDTVVVTHGGYVYIFVGQFMEEDSPLRQSFASIVDSVRFIPTHSQVGGKLDINAVCDGALSYMTFPDGASADAFLVECKEGKHPEVIEEYRQQMGLGDGAAI